MPIKCILSYFQIYLHNILEIIIGEWPMPGPLLLILLMILVNMPEES
jgi:hypothetical protein